MHFVIPIVAAVFLLTLAGSQSSASLTPAEDGAVLMARESFISGIVPVKSIGSTVDSFSEAGTVRRNSRRATTADSSETENRSPVVDTLGVQNIGTSNALLRGTAQVYNRTNATVFFLTATETRSLKAATKLSSFEALTDRLPKGVTLEFVTSRGSGEDTYTRRVQGLTSGTTYFVQLCVDVGSGALSCGDIVSFATVASVTSLDDFKVPTVSLSRASDINASTATINGSYKIGAVEEATVFVVYGTNRTEVQAIEADALSYAAIDTKEDTLMKARVAARAKGAQPVSYQIDDLENGTEYFYVLCVSYIAARDGVSCTNVSTFTTDERDRRAPRIVLNGVENVGTGVAITGSIMMNSYRSGHGFIVYGTDMQAVQGVTDKSSFSSIRQRGDELQLVSLDIDIDGTFEVASTLRQLSPRSTFYTSLCVQFEDEDDRGNSIDVIACSGTQQFSTQ